MLLYCCHINSRSIYFWIWKVNLSRQPPNYENLSCLQFRFELAASTAHSSSWHCCCCSEQSRAEQPLSTLCQPPLGGRCICWKSSLVCKNPCCPPCLIKKAVAQRACSNCDLGPMNCKNLAAHHNHTYTTHQEQTANSATVVDICLIFI